MNKVERKVEKNNEKYQNRKFITENTDSKQEMKVLIE
jgi:hypothetical protein